MRTRPTFALFSCCREFFDWVTSGDDHWYEVSIRALDARSHPHSGPQRRAEVKRVNGDV